MLHKERWQLVSESNCIVAPRLQPLNSIPSPVHANRAELVYTQERNGQITPNRTALFGGIYEIGDLPLNDPLNGKQEKPYRVLSR